MPILLSLESIKFGWKKQDSATDTVLDIASFSIDRHQHCFVMGPSGCGKSTLLSLIGGVITPCEGAVLLDGIELTGQRPAARDRVRADKIGYVFQQFNLVPYLSAYENVLLPCQFSGTRENNAIKRDGSAKAAAKRLLDGFFVNNTPDFHKPVGEMSVGQQQRVAAARALVGSPALIIADEPTSALDHDSRLRFMSLLLKESSEQGSTLLFVSHDPTLASEFPQVCNMAEINQGTD